MYRIVRRQAFSEITFLWEVLAPDVARAARPGQFLMIRLREGGERIPLTVADFDRDRGTVTMVIQATGKTTFEMATHYDEGDEFADFAGPLGRPQHIERVGHVVLVGGGLGVAPIYPQLRGFREVGCRTTGIIGFRSQPQIFWEDKFREQCDRLIVCTDDGSYGRPGFVTEALSEILIEDPPDLVVAIGPLPMMQACVETTRPAAVKTMVSLNTIMVDGTGMCGSCRVSVDGETKFACVDGPDFNGHQVDFPELVARQSRFKAEEARAREEYSHLCHLERALFEEEKRNYKKIKDLAPTQTPMPERDPIERSRTFQEVNLGYGLEQALQEAERCLQCAKPKCVAGCPVQIDIPGFIRHLLVHDLDGAAAVIRESNAFPSICGRVCPQESQCEAQCIIRAKVEPVAIGRLERFIGDYAAMPAPVRPDTQPKLGRVAICGAGPAGLAAAADLAKYGCEVTIYEALHVVGGVLQYGIPAFRLPRDIIAREVQRLRDQGVEIVTNKVIGRTFTVSQLLDEMGYDAVFLGVGAGAPTFLGVPGENAATVYSANELLTRVNLMGGDRFPYCDTPIRVGQDVVVVGAGNTAMDCLRVAKRLGARRVTCVYRRSEAEAPARIEEIRHAKEEGIELLFLHAPVEIRTDTEGNVRAMTVERMDLGEADERGRRRPIPTGERRDIPCDTVIAALGTRANSIVTESAPDLAVDARGYIRAEDGAPDSTQATNLPGVFAGGDIVTGGATVILAMGAGRRAARSIAAYLRSGKKWPVTPDDVQADGSSLGHEESLRVGGETPRPSQSSGSVCPKCRQPLEDGEEAYLCCAGEQLEWTCLDCHKVSEGFAFPYGRCPDCGGSLRPSEPRKIEGPAALEAIRTAFEIELGGGAFYRGAAKEAQDPALKELFGRFAEMEAQHMATLARRYHVAPLPTSDDFPVDRAAIYAGIDGRPEDPISLFRIAIACEERAVAFFSQRSERTPAGSAEERLYRELAAEEREHATLLRTELERYRDGKPGLL